MYKYIKNNTNSQNLSREEIRAVRRKRRDKNERKKRRNEEVKNEF